MNHDEPQACISFTHVSVRDGDNLKLIPKILLVEKDSKSLLKLKEQMQFINSYFDTDIKG